MMRWMAELRDGFRDGIPRQWRIGPHAALLLPTLPDACGPGSSCRCSRGDSGWSVFGIPVDVDHALGNVEVVLR